MSSLKYARAVLAAAAVLTLAGCGDLGQVEQGRVIAYDKQTRRVTLIREARPAEAAGSGILPPVTIEAPADPKEMGPAPAAGGLMRLDYKNQRLVIFDRGAQAFRTIPYTTVREQRNVAKNPGAAVVDKAAKTITIYAAVQRALITFRAPDELLALPADTWRAGDVVRYYYKDPGQALRLMNVTKTDLSKSG